MAEKWWYQVSLDWFYDDKTRRMNHIVYGSLNEVWDSILQSYEENEIDNIKIKSLAIDEGSLLTLNDDVMEELEKVRNDK